MLLNHLKNYLKGQERKKNSVKSRFQGRKIESSQRIRDIVLELDVKGQQKIKWKQFLEGMNSFPL